MQLKGNIFIANKQRDLSETIVFKLNPSRIALIKEKTGWTEVFPGTLNIYTDKASFDTLRTITPFFTEPIVRYPDKFSHIPIKHNGYKYYKANIIFDKPFPVLLRIPNCPRTYEVSIVSNVKLIDVLTLKANTDIILDINISVINATPSNVFYNDRGEHMPLENHWKNASVFVISSGPSFKDFKDKDKLRFVQTIGINNSPKALMPFTRPNMWISVDPPHKFLYTIWQDPQVMKLVPMGKNSKKLWNSDLNEPLVKTVNQCPNVVYFKLNHQLNVDSYLTEDTVNWGNNGDIRDPNNNVNGKRSVFIACLKVLYSMGFRNVFLMGADFDMQPGNVYSFAETKHAGGCRSNNNTYKQMNFWFKQLQPRFLDAGYYVYNCNPNSKLEAFPYMSFDDGFKKALNFIHDTNAYIANKIENVTNMYNAKWITCNKCNKDYVVPDQELESGQYKCIKCNNVIIVPVKEKKRKKKK